MTIEPGHIVRTNYSGPYVVLAVLDDCRCADYVESLDCEGAACAGRMNCDNCPAVMVPHLHITCRRLDKPAPVRPADQFTIGRIVPVDATHYQILDTGDTLEIIDSIPNRQLPLF